MPKLRRPYAPGCIFHVTARTQGKVRWFEQEGMRDHIADIICDASVMARTAVIAFVVMPNHFHLIVRQSQTPLAWLMHRVMHRTALLVKKRFSPDGHVFGARYYTGLCDDAFHARQVVLYTHLNPFRAGLVAHPREYPWSSYHNYTAAPCSSQWNPAVEDGLNLFAMHTDAVQHMRENHDLHIAYWMKREHLPLTEKYIFTPGDELTAPRADCGDTYWNQLCCPTENARQSPPGRAMMPVADRATVLLRQLDGDMSLDYVRTCGRGRSISKLRRELIAALLSDGYTGTAIARCLNVSSALVSAVRLDVEKARFRPIAGGGGPET